MATKERLIIESMLQIPTKDKYDVPFRLNAAQAQLDAKLTGRDIIPKSRQRGISSYFLARYTIKCLSEQNTRAVVISHDKESTQRMLSRVHYFLNHMDPKPVIKNASKNELTFPKTNSMFYIGTAGQKKFGRGDTITNLHCSEVAYWPDPKGLTGGLFQAVPANSGEIAIESTGNGVGNWYHRRAMRAAQAGSRYRLHFFGWLDDPDCIKPVTAEQAEDIMSNLDIDLDEPDLVEQYRVSAGQLAWRREKLEDMDYDMRLFRQEYPLTLDECFQASGHSLFHRVFFMPTPEWRRVTAELYLLEGHPSPGHIYGIGADVGGGVGGDNSVAEIIDLEAMEQVGEWVSNRLPPDVFAGKLASLGKEFNWAYLTPESNNHGLVTVHELKKIYPTHLIYRQKGESDHLVEYGSKTTARSKPLIIGKLRLALAGGMVIHSELLRNELSTFVEKEDGKLEAEEGCMDDRVIALAEAVNGFNKAVMMLAKAPPAPIQSFDPFSFDSIINELRGRKGQGEFPIASHVRI